MKYGDVIIAIMAILVIVMMILPLPAPLIDILLAFNITFSMIILLISMNMERPLDFSIFPSLLLLTTILRLSLNVSSTRLILIDGYAGKVIESFGNFVVKGNPLVGFIIFIIIVTVQFVVITKGAERVAEVAARFTLDAMPGKQMSIDADLNAGVISESEARKRRQEIQKEADFYGAMDGASKFVKGDAIAGIIIAIINVVGGLVTGVIIQEMELSDALRRYTLLTVGDGLVSQIPALLISTATGVVVTKAAGSGHLGDDLMRQLSAYPKLLLLSAGALVFFAVIPGLPFVPFIILAGTLGYMSLTLQKASNLKDQEAEQLQKEKELDEMRKPENIYSLLQVDSIEVEFGYNIIPLADANQGGDLLDRVVMIRRQCALDLGMVVPMIRLRDNIQLKPNEYIIKIKGIEAARGELRPENYMVMNPTGGPIEIEGIRTKEPAFGLPARWISSDKKEIAEMKGYTIVDSSSVLATHMTEIIKQYAHELLGWQEVKKLLNNLESHYPALIEDIVPKIITIGEIQKVLSNLLRENVPIRDIVTILETLGDYAKLTKDPDVLTEYVRQRLKRVITERFVTDKFAQVITLDAQVEDLILNSIRQNDQGSYIAMEPTMIQKIKNSLIKIVNDLNTKNISPIVLTNPMVRVYFKRIIEDYISFLPVLSYNELEPGVERQSVGTVTLK